MSVTIRPCSAQDVDAVASFVGRCPPLVEHTRFTYWVTLHFWGRLCFVAESADHEVLGFSSAVGTAVDPRLLYLWQIGIAPGQRGRGLGRQMLEAFADAARGSGYDKVQVSIELGNVDSRKLFESFAAREGGHLDEMEEADAPAPDERTYRFDLRGPLMAGSAE